jgi:hypothetical protein
VSRVHLPRLAALIVLLCLGLAAPASATYPGANGRIAYQGYRSLGTINAEGGDRRLALDGNVAGDNYGAYFTPAWSPDGTRLVFASDKAGGDGDIFVMPAMGGLVTPLTANTAEDGQPAWSPDGTRIAFSSDRGGKPEIWVMNADGSNPIALTASVLDADAPAWSPDGTRIAFARGSSGGGQDIWTMTAQGGDLRRLTSTASSDETNPDWSPDGRRIVFQRDTGIVVMNADGSGQTPLTGLGSADGPVWSPDGARIAYGLGLELWAANPDGTGATQLTTAGTVALATRNPAWQTIPPVAPPGGGGGGGGTTPGTGGGTGGGTTPGGGTTADPLDKDGDGVLAPADCRDDDAKIHPGADDIPGDGIDQDCRGGDARLPVLDRAFAFSHNFNRVATKFTSLVVRPVRQGDTLKLTCAGRGCPWKAKTYKIRKNAKRKSLEGPLQGKALRTGTVVQLRVTHKFTLGRVYTWTMRSGKPPKVSRLCLRPGAKKPTRCPA